MDVLQRVLKQGAVRPWRPHRRPLIMCKGKNCAWDETSWVTAQAALSTGTPQPRLASRRVPRLTFSHLASYPPYVTWSFRSIPSEYDTGVGATEAEVVAHHGVQGNVFPSFH